MHCVMPRIQSTILVQVSSYVYTRQLLVERNYVHHRRMSHSTAKLDANWQCDYSFAADSFGAGSHRYFLTHRERETFVIGHSL